jgi:hypothetical protein
VSSLLRRLELECTGLDFLIPSGHYIDPARADRAAGAAMAAIELAADLGRASLTVEFSAALTGSNRDDPSRALLDAIIAHAERFGVALANLGSVAAPIDGLGIALDLPGLAAQRSLTSAVAALKTAAIVSVRCSGVTETGARVPFGRDSRIDPAECQLAIAGAGYQRAVVLDARGWADPLAGLEQSAAAWSAANPFLAR